MCLPIFALYGFLIFMILTTDRMRDDPLSYVAIVYMCALMIASIGLFVVIYWFIIVGSNHTIIDNEPELPILRFEDIL